MQPQFLLEKFKLSEWVEKVQLNFDEITQEVTIEVKPTMLIKLMIWLKNNEDMKFSQLTDLCGVDYLTYGCSELDNTRTISSEFSSNIYQNLSKYDSSRFAVVYHLLSLEHNHRVRVRVYCQTEPPIVHSVIDIWPSANWFEREAFDLFGIWFKGHPDLRRLLTDYGFIGHPFRKDFPLIGEVEMRYDASENRVVYELVSIEPRTSVPKVIREDSRYIDSE